jgi:hypothetical protein
MFLKEKRDGTVKGRTCADGRKQRETVEPGAATSPTVSLESVLINSTIEAYEGSEVAVVDIPGAYLSADMDEEVIMLLRGRLAELMVKTAPNIYRKYITVDAKNQPVLYVKLQKALNGCLRSALLFYLKFDGDIELRGFTLNSYDPCVANRVINGKQFTVVWHVDDIKMSHADEKEVCRLITWLKSVYGEDIRVSRGKVHDYLGMTLDFTNKVEVKITMIDYLKRVINDFPEIITGTAITPATANLFDVRPEDERKVLGQEQARAFHHSVAQLLFATTRAIKDIQHTVAFLTTRVKSPDEDDWMKLKRLLKYIRGTIYMPLILKADSLNIVKWWVDASYATHSDCKGHTGATMSMGTGSITGISKKQKINTRSSTESELVGVHDVAPQMLWTRYFIKAQGYKLKESILHQDNMSAMLLETNGKESSSKRTKHINVRCFFIKDRVGAGEITIKHCPTNDMLADHFTKAVQGSQFRKLRSKIQGIPEDVNDALMGWDRPSLKTKMMGIPSPQECVGTNTIRAYDITPPPGSKAVTTLSADAGTVTTPSANAGATGSILTT